MIVAKREGLAMGSYRNKSKRYMDKYAPGIEWAKEGEWVITLGVPVGNDLDHTKWWKHKIKAVRSRANRWSNLFRSGYFGRNLVVQAMYFGSLRYWLWSLHIDRSTITTVGYHTGVTRSHAQSTIHHLVRSCMDPQRTESR